MLHRRKEEWVKQGSDIPESLLVKRGIGLSHDGSPHLVTGIQSIYDCVCSKIKAKVLFGCILISEF